MERYQKLNPSYACLFIDHKRKKVSFNYPQKNSTFEMLLIGFFQIWLRIFILFFVVNLLLVAIWTVVVVSDREDPTSATTHDYTIPIVMIMAALIFLFIGPPLILTLVFMYNEKLLKIYPEIYTKFSKLMDGWHYVKVTKLKSTVYEIPLFENTFLDYKIVGDFRKYLKDVQVKNYQFKHKMRYFWSKKVDTEKCIDYWKATFKFTQIPKKGFLEVNFH